MSYEITSGNADPICVDKHSSLKFRDGAEDSVLPGVKFMGVYAARLPVVSFMYHKQDPLSGELERFGRLVVGTGFGKGVYEGHEGQDPTIYLIGADIARVNQETGDLVKWVVDFEAGGLVTPKHFSLDCIMDGVRGDEPVLANGGMLEA